MMHEPLPLLDDDEADPTVRRLLGSARGDAPSSSALRAAPAAIAALLVSHGGLAAGAAATTTGALAAAGSSTTASVIVLGKWFGVGTLLGTVSVATITATTSAPERPVASASARPPRALPAPSARVAPQPAKIAPSTVLSAPPAPDVRSSAPKPDLALEVRLLDDARAALGAGDAQRALRVLSRVEALPSRLLVPESTVLRVRALIAAGRADEARRAGDDFLRRSPTSPQAAVVRSLLTNLEAP